MWKTTHHIIKHINISMSIYVCKYTSVYLFSIYIHNYSPLRTLCQPRASNWPGHSNCFACKSKNIFSKLVALRVYKRLIIPNTHKYTTDVSPPYTARFIHSLITHTPRMLHWKNRQHSIRAVLPPSQHYLHVVGHNAAEQLRYTTTTI